MRIARHCLVAVGVLCLTVWSGYANAVSPETTTELRRPVVEDEHSGRALRAEREYRHRLARLRRLRQLARRHDNVQRLAALDALFDRLHGAHEARLDRQRSRLSGDALKTLDAQLKQGRDRQEKFTGEHHDKMVKHHKRESARDHAAAQRREIKHRRADGREHVTAKRKEFRHRKELSRDHAAAERREIRHRRADGREHVAAKRKEFRHRKELARDHAAAQRREVKHRRADGREHVAAERNELRHRKELARDHAASERREIKHRRGEARLDAGAQRQDAKDRWVKAREHDRRARFQKVRGRARLWSQEEADASAAAAITSANFEAEFERLRKEIERDD